MCVCLDITSMQSKQLCAAKSSSSHAAKQRVSQPRSGGCWRDRRQADQVNFSKLFDANISFSLCVHTHLYLTSDCHNFGWWMHWLDELSLYTWGSACRSPHTHRRQVEVSFHLPINAGVIAGLARQPTIARITTHITFCTKCTSACAPSQAAQHSTQVCVSSSFVMHSGQLLIRVY